MSKHVRLIIGGILITVCTAVFAQNEGYNTLYSPLSLVKRLSYENFRDIKFLQSAIVNFGGGESEVDKLVDQYAEASALYFQNKIEDSAKKFQENQKQILLVSQNLARKYKADSEKLLNDCLKLNIKLSLNDALKGKKQNETADKSLKNGQFGVQKANDIFDTYINATTASPYEMIKTIYYYRKAKENLIIMYQVSNIDKNEKEKLLEKFKKDMDDNKNKVYESREKKN